MSDPWRAFMPYPAVPVASGQGPLEGLRLAVKDLFDVAGYRTSCGNPIKLAQSPVASAHAPAVARLLDAGASFAGKAQTDELAWSLIGNNPHFGAVVNPAAPDRVSGGSSSGSAAAVAAGLADIALGTDTGGSVRAPAAFCGTWGLRPTWGRAPLEGCMPLVPSFDTCGLFARDGATLLLAARALLGEEGGALSKGVPLASDMMAAVVPEVRLALEPALAGADGTVDLFVDDPQRMHDIFDVIQSREVVAQHGAWIDAFRPPLSEFIRARYEKALTVTAEQEAAARMDRERMTAAILDRLAGRAVLAPVVHDLPPRAALPVPELLAYAAEARKLLCIAGIAGLPQVVFPATSLHGVPVALSLIGPPGSDLALIEHAIAFTTVPA